MKKILGLTVAALMVMGLVGGGTWAYFSDTETIDDNPFAAGTLDLGLSETQSGTQTGSITGTFDGSAWAPGDSVNATIYVNNEGSIEMSSVNITFATTGVVDGTPGTVDAGPGGSTDNLTEMITLTDLKFGTIGSPGDIATWDGYDIGQLISTEIALGNIPADTEYELFMEFTFDTTATNGCQGDSTNITMTFTGLQQ
jgi:predicted ribosomally synthesized peptide with SipW-like signal peptide